MPGLSRVGGAQSDPPPPLALAAWAQARQGWVSAESSPRVSAVWSFSEELAEPWAGCTGRIRGWRRGGCGGWRESVYFGSRTSRTQNVGKADGI